MVLPGWSLAVRVPALAVGRGPDEGQDSTVEK